LHTAGATFKFFVSFVFAHAAGESMPADEQCAEVARIQGMMPWVQAGTDFFDGSHIVCNTTATQ
jgi:hypothetical protein